MRRRELAKLLMASAASSAAQRSHSEGARLAPWSLLDRSGYVRIPDGSYRNESTLRILLQNTIIGESRQNTIVASAGEFVLEVGDPKQAPNAGLIQRLRLFGSAANRACVHMSSGCHMWRLEELLFSGGPCPALLVENCWDSNYADIDVLAHAGVSANPAQGAAVIFAAGCNNIYCRGLRVEAADSGGLYVDSGPIYLVTGKLDDGFRPTQTAAAITVGTAGHLVVDDFYCGGTLAQYPVDLAGTLKLGRVLFDGGTRTPAAIFDHRAWSHVNPQTFAGAAATYFGPQIGTLDLGAAQFKRFHPSVDSDTPAAVYSRIHPIRQLRRLTAARNGPASATTRWVDTTATGSHDNLYANSFLVHNSSGTLAGAAPGARRRILQSFANGKLLLQGSSPVLLDDDWSIEYCAAHRTPIRASGVWLDRDQSLFAVVADHVGVASQPRYQTHSEDGDHGTTVFRLHAPQLAAGRDLRGLFLVDLHSGEPFYIEHGMDAEGNIGVIYDRSAELDIRRSYQIVAGYDARIELLGAHVLWSHAGIARQVPIAELLQAGFSPEDFPLWGIGFASSAEDAAEGWARLQLDGVIVSVDLSRAAQWEIDVTHSRPFSIADPTPVPLEPGQRLGLTLRNLASASLGTVSWGGSYRLSPWTGPAVAHCRTIEFRFDGRCWIEVARTPADVPL
ncbi:MAG TPA: hypothetical protein VME21_08325 [Steroidobacteraceae bacterium]|nr:hypothetical protein [Steroidobacteraceae bacterium]